MRITICAHEYSDYIGGPSIWLQRITREFRRRGIESTILFTRAKCKNDCLTIRELRNQGYQCEIYRGYRYTEPEIKWILQKVRENPPDIFIANMDISALYASRWIKLAGIPTIGILRSDEMRYYGFIDEFVEKKNPFLLSGLVCVSQHLENLAKERNPNGVVIKRISSGTELPEVHATKPNTTLKLVYVGKLVEEAKQITKLTHAMIRAVKEVDSCEAYIYGNGPKFEKIKALVSDSNCTHALHVEGRIDNNRIYEILSSKHVFVLLSDFEGLPVSLMEAMACGVVPVCLNIQSGIPELISNNDNGLLVDNRDDDFISAIKRLKNDGRLWHRLSKNAREKIKSEYSIGVVTSKWESLFNELLTENIGKKAIEIPKYFDLPPVNPKMRKADKRWSGLTRHLYVQSRRAARRFFHSIRN
jgi:colanic acid/amylovoran biosynthesis glycosyltransferase